MDWITALILLGTFVCFPPREKKLPKPKTEDCVYSMDEAVDYIFERMEQRGTPESKEQIRGNLELFVLEKKMVSCKQGLWIRYYAHYARIQDYHIVTGRFDYGGKLNLV